MTRIVGGSARGRTLVTPAGLATRPTSDRAREGLFNSLGNLAAPTFLDLYAGTGAVGLEALSRGAVSATLVESAPAALAAIRANVATLGLPGAVVSALTVERFLAGARQTFDVVFLDAPYAADLTAVLVSARTVIGDRVVIERATRDDEPPWPEGVELIKSRRYGEATLWYGARP